ncbi:Retrotransposon gag domain [Sesbania bispinosa]|nr:Retrotransposon gag domain [Sesbania bispinosa]
MQAREELNLLGGVETPHQPESGVHGPYHTVIPTAVLNSILTNQQNLADLVADLKTQNRKNEKETPVQRHGEASVMQSGDALVTQAELRRLLQAERNGPGDVFDLEPPLVNEVLVVSYPTGYQPPSFRKFDGTGSAREHLMCFLDDLGIHRDDKGNTRLRGRGEKILEEVALKPIPSHEALDPFWLHGGTTTTRQLWEGFTTVLQPPSCGAVAASNTPFAAANFAAIVFLLLSALLRAPPCHPAAVASHSMINYSPRPSPSLSQSLAGRAFTWYVKLRPCSIRTWEELAAEFCGKFLEEEGAIHIMDLGRAKQKSGESLVAFVKRYRDRALQCKETLPEADLVYGCIKNIEDGSQIFLSLGGITTFAEFIRQGSDVAEAIKRQGKRSKETENVFDVCALDEREKKNNFRMSPSPRKFTFNDVDELPRMPISRAQACQLTEDWLKDGTIQTKLKVGKVLLPEMEGVEGELHRRPLPDHGVNAIASSSQGRIRIEEVDDEANAEKEMLVNGLTKTRGWRILFGQLGLGWDAQQEAVKALVKIAQNQGGELGRSQWPKFCHNHPLYVEANIEGIRVRRALVDNGSGVNILPSYLFKMLNIPKHRLRVSDVTLNTFHGEPVESRGCVNAVLEVGPIKTVNTFQVVDGDPSYHLLLGRPWIHLHQCIPSTLHQCIKSNFRGKKIEIPGVTTPFEATEAHLIDASLFNELAPPGSSRIHREQYVPLGGKGIVQERRNTLHQWSTPKRHRGGNNGGIQKEYMPNGEMRWRIL